MSEQMSLDTRERDTGGNYIADDDTYPRCVWFANGRKVAIEYTEVNNEIEGGDAYLTVEREMHPAFAVMQKSDDGAAPITEEWLRSVGFIHSEVVLDRMTIDINRSRSLCVDIADGESGLSCIDAGYVTLLYAGRRTRRDVRRLAAALGISLSERVG